MAEKTRILGHGSLTIGANQSVKDFSADCTNIKVTPDTNSEDPDTFLDGHEEAGAQTTTWTVEGTVKEDYSTDGLQAWCLAHAGEILPFTVIPNNTAKLKITGNLTVAPLGFGGDVKARNDIDFSFSATDIATASTATGD